MGYAFLKLKYWEFNSEAAYYQAWSPKFLGSSVFSLSPALELHLPKHLNTLLEISISITG